jgi:ATP-dependent Clp protease ATP-binding subunit ClpB
VEIGSTSTAIESLQSARALVEKVATAYSADKAVFSEVMPIVEQASTGMEKAWLDFSAARPNDADLSVKLLRSAGELSGEAGRWNGWMQLDAARTATEMKKQDGPKHALGLIDDALKQLETGEPQTPPAGFSDAARAASLLAASRQSLKVMEARFATAHGGTLNIDEVAGLGDKVSGALSEAANHMARAPQKLASTERIGDQSIIVTNISEHLRGWKDIKDVNDMGVGDGWNFATNAIKDIDHAAAQLNGILASGAQQAGGAVKWTPPALPKELEDFGVDLTAEAAAGQLHEVVGRSSETNALIDAVKNGSGIIIGEPGTGKTAIAEGLAQRIVSGDVPLELQNTRIFSLDVNKLGMSSGTVGDGEKRMQTFIDGVMKDSTPTVVLIDEIHSLMGVGAYRGHEAGLEQVLKPYLASGKLRIIGATTSKEYEKFIEPDGAFARRLTKIAINPPSPEDTLYILRKRFAAHPQLQIDDDALSTALKISERLYPDRYQPDKAIKLVDATIKQRVRELTSPPAELLDLNDAVARMTVELEGMKKSPAPSQTRIASLEQRLADATAQQQKLAADYDLARYGQPETRTAFQKAKLELEKDPGSRDKAAEVDRLGTQLAGQRLEGAQAFPGMDRSSLTSADVEKVASVQTGVRAGAATADTKRLLDTLPEAIDERIVGQPAAKDAFTRVIRRSYSPFRDPDRPRGVILALGPTGVGKTELAEVVAEHMGSEATTIDMSQFADKYSVNNLFGPPKGYVGYDDGGALTGAARKRPDAFIVLDEVEKAHKDVWDSALPLFEEGRLTDSKLGEVSFKNNTIVMTSNLRNTDDLKNYFRPELLNRIDEIVVFDHLDEATIRKIVDIQLGIMQSRAPRIQLEVSEAAKAEIARVGYDPEMGARPVRRAIQKNVEDVLASHLIGADPDVGGVAKVDFTPEGGFTGSFTPAT